MSFLLTTTIVLHLSLFQNDYLFRKLSLKFFLQFLEKIEEIMAVDIREDFEHREDGHLYRLKSNRNVKAGDSFGFVSANGYIEGFYRGAKTSEHRLVWEFYNGPIPEGLEIDHEDHVRSNNRIGNLRIATQNQNQHNRIINKNSSTGIKGVGIKCENGKTCYYAKVSLNKVRKVKRFPLTQQGLKDAEQWTKSLRLDLHKEFYHHG